LTAWWLAGLLVVIPAASARSQAQVEAPPTQAPATTAQPDVEAGSEAPAPVMLGGEIVVWITEGTGPYTPQYRAERIGRRLEEVVHDRSLKDPTVTITDVEGSSELRVGARLLMVVTGRDAHRLGVSRELAAQHAAQALEAAIRAERLRYAPETIARSGVHGVVATLVLLATLWLIGRLTRFLRTRIDRWRAGRLHAIVVQKVEVLSAEHVSRFVDRAIRLARFVLVLLVLDLYLTYVLGLFPWTRAVSFTLLESALAPARAVGRAVVGYLPNLFFVVVIGAFFFVAIRLVGFFFHLVGQGRIEFPSFPGEWADPTNKVARVLLIALGVVVAFPYLPASGSPAFAGVSVFMGVLISLASSSSLSNMIAGLVLTYTGAFRLGDRVQIGEAYGDIVETSLLATRVRTIKNEEITIPNGIVLGSSVTNYSRAARQGGVIMHTSVTIGYDAPWRTVHQLLLNAAAATPGLLADPKPFVWQTALNDFYVTYEINAYTDAPAEMPAIYAALHANIQDAFYKGGVEIMSPHVTALRDGNTVAIPEALRPSGYRPGAFRLENTAPGANESQPR
jgi:small-conductance mechanosensitive channel